MNKNAGSFADEIDLKELCCLLWQGRRLMGTVFLTVLACSAAYAFLAKPVYQAEFRILPPAGVQLSAYHSLADQLERLMPEDANKSVVLPIQTQSSNSLPDDKDLYDRYTENLQSNVVQSEFLSKVFIPDLSGRAGHADAQWQGVLDNALTITPPKINGTVTTLAFSGSDPKQLVDWLNRYLETTQDLTRRQVQGALTARQGFVLKLVREHIQALRNQAKADRMSSIRQAQDALSVAKGIGLQDASPQTQWSDNMSRGGGLMYLQGTRALTAILAELQARTDDDAYIPKLPSLLEKERQLQQLDVTTNLEFAYIDRPAFPPSQPVKPRRALIIALGGVLGLLLGVLAIFLRRALK
ncbi:Wzz/FepE/Etk N-terminal domain-containing protein [Castellaniella sp.]|uniref:Wzz/FepE/Etk N-terminal domain-containing protein n=1 Tax=Castellaniella sp. TaxID=1955812 RepID=UPI003C740265